MTEFQWRYNAVIRDEKAIYDADTVTLFVDLGFKTFTQIRARLYGIDAWEVRGPEREMGKEARDWLRQTIAGKTVEIESFKDKTGKFGRWLVVIYLHKDGERININQKLIDMGFAEENYYGNPPKED